MLGVGLGLGLRLRAKGYYGHLSAQLAQPTRHQRIGLSKVPG